MTDKVCFTTESGNIHILVEASDKSVATVVGYRIMELFRLSSMVIPQDQDFPRYKVLILSGTGLFQDNISFPPTEGILSDDL